MNRTASRIGNVDFDAQAAAREAARREGKSLGQWLHGAISERAADLGVREGDLAGRERIEAITARLDRLGSASTLAATPRRPARPGRGDVFRARAQDGREGRGREAGDRESFSRDEPAGGRSFRRGAEEERATSYRGSMEDARDDESGEDALLAEAMASMDRRAARSERRTDEALASFAQLMEQNEARRSGERDAVHALARQMATLQSTLSERTAAGDGPIKGALARLEARLDLIGKRSAAEETARRPIEHDEPLRRLENKINTLLQAVHGAPSRRVTEDAQAAGGAAATHASVLAIGAAQAAEAPRRRFGDAIAEISRRQHNLEHQQGPEREPTHGTEDAATPDARRSADADWKGAEREGASRENAGREARAASVWPEQERLREEISAIAARMGASVPVAPPEARLVEPTARPDPATAASLRLIEERLDAISGRLQDAAERPDREPQLDALEAMVRDLAGRLDAVGLANDAVSSADPQVLDQLQRRVEALADRFDRSEQELSLLPALAASVRKLFDEHETVRASVETAAAETAREAARQLASQVASQAASQVASKVASQVARDVLREAADERGRQAADIPALPVAPAAPAAPGPDVVVAMQSMQSMLSGVHDVLDRMVGRLAAVETDLAAVRTRPAAEPVPAEPRSPQVAGPSRSPAPQQPPAAPSGPTFTAAPGFDRQPHAAPQDGPAFRPATQRPAAPRMPAADAVREPILPPAAKRGETSSAPRLAADEDAQRLNFIAAARRAARSAQAEAAQLDAAQHEGGQLEAARLEAAPLRRPQAEARPGSEGRSAAEAEARAGLLAKSRDYVAAHKRPLLMGLAAIMVVVGTLALLQRTGLGGSETVALAPQPARLARVEAPEPSRLVAEAAPAMPVAPMPTAPVSVAANSTAPTPAASVSDAIASDPTPTGSISSLPAFAAQTPGAARPPAAGPAIPGQTAGALPVGLQASAEAGNAAAQYDLGARYADGRGIGRDARLAALWLGRAAERDLPPAQYRLAMLFEKGVGVAVDKVRARALYTAAAEAGNPRAMHNLAVMLADGDGHPDYGAAAGWFRKAAGYGVHDSQYNLAILLARGLGTAQSLVQSYQWFAIAAAANDADAAHKRDEVGSKLNPGDLAMAKSLAAAYQPRSADPAAVEVAVPAGDGAAGASHLNSVKSKVSAL